MKIKNLNLKETLKYFGIFFLCFVFSQAEICNISPFLFAFYFACLYVCLNEKVLSSFVLVCALSNGFNLEVFLTHLTVVAVGLIFVYIHKFAKRKVHLFTTFLSFVVGNVTYIYYNFQNFKNWTIYVGFGLICLFVFITVLQVMLLRKNCLKLTLDESICFLFAMSSIGLGLSSVIFFNFELARFFIVFSLLICVAIGSPSLTYPIVMAFSLGCSLATLSLVPVAEYVILALLTSVFSMPNKFKIVFMVVVSDIFVQYFFITKTTEIIYAIIPVVLASILFLCIPNKTLNALSDLFYIKKSEITSRNVINMTRKNIKKRMFELSNVFLDMKQIHLNMTKKELTKEELIAMLTREILSSTCYDCLDKNRCTRSLGIDNKSNLELLVEIAVNKGKVTLLDVPSTLANRCGKVNNLITLINRIVDEYKQYKNVMADVNNVKILMADQMGAVS
ncbi:MAG: hypothetical protein IKY10_03965, partial [Clostridia bacterium]|nr:hypothetical protein [Clostridia bacterium]